MMINKEKNNIEARESLGKLISCIYRYNQIYIGKELEQYSIGSGQFSFLMRLYHKDRIHQEDLAQFLKVDKATSARAIQKLAEKGYVIKERDSSDRRAYKIFLTKKGKNLEQIVKKISAEWGKILLSGFTKDEKKFLIESLKKMVHNASSIK